LLAFADRLPFIALSDRIAMAIGRLNMLYRESVAKCERKHRLTFLVHDFDAVIEIDGAIPDVCAYHVPGIGERIFPRTRHIREFGALFVQDAERVVEMEIVTRHSCHRAAGMAAVQRAAARSSDEHGRTNLLLRNEFPGFNLGYQTFSGGPAAAIEAGMRPLRFQWQSRRRNSKLRAGKFR
jgi:hypothetical protein